MTSLNRPQFVSAPVVILSLSLTYFLLAGFAVGGFSYEYIFYATALKYKDSFAVDPLASEMIPTSVSYLFFVFYPIYDVPLIHLAFGILLRFLAIMAVWHMSKRMTGSALAATLSVLMVFVMARVVWGKPIGFLTNFPLGTATALRELVGPLYLSFRQAALVFALGSAIFLLRRQFILSSFLLGLGFYLHPINTIAFFITFTLCLPLASDVPLCFRTLRRQITFFLIFLLTILPYIIRNMKMFSGIEPVPIGEYWQFLLSNEPDDVSTRWQLLHTTHLTVPLALSVVVTLGRIFLRYISEAGRGHVAGNNEHKLTYGLIWVPWIVIGISWVLEGHYDQIPGWLVDFLIPAQLHRLSSVSALFAIVVLSWEVVTLLKLFLLMFHRGRSLFVKLAGSFKSIYMLSLIIFLGGTILVLCNKHKLSIVKSYISPHNKPPEFFIGAQIAEFHKDFRQSLIPSTSFIDVCRWIRSNTSKKAAFINPPYLYGFRSCSQRQGFLSEVFDGNLAFTNRKFATVYLRRFFDLLRPLSYTNLPHPVKVESGAYSLIRDRYLSLTASEIDQLTKSYPGYRYLLTESDHLLPYRIVYRNDFFRVYELGSFRE